MKKFLPLLVVIFIILLTGCSNNSIENNLNDIPLQKLSSKETGIDFFNTVTPNLETKENLFDYDYFYNGSGVGIADINNDGLKDVFFTSNQTRNKLY